MKEKPSARASIFISYRSDDGKAWAINLYEALAPRFGADEVFLDKEHLRVGDWHAQLLERVQACKVFLLVIGRNWLTATDSASERRLEQTDDVHRLEVATALARHDVTVIPILVDEAQMPREKQLPEKLQELPKHQWRRLYDERKHRDVAIDALAQDISASSGLPVGGAADVTAADHSPAPPSAAKLGQTLVRTLVIAFVLTITLAVLAYLGGMPLPDDAFPVVLALCGLLAWSLRGFGTRKGTRRSEKSKPKPGD